MINKKDYEIGDEIRAWSVYIPDQAIIEVTNTLKSKWINTGKKEKEFRGKIEKKLSTPHAIACNSGTSALKAALSALGIGIGDEVVSTPFTFIATNTAILEVGARPVFADISYDNLNLNPRSIEDKITSRTKAIICVHYGGNPCDMDEIWEIGKKYSLPVIEDSAHALCSKYKDHYIGSRGDIACFSLQVVKIVTAGDGGVITTTHDEYYKKIREKIWYGINRDAKKFDILDPFPHHPKGLGYKMNMNDITASLACVAIDSIEEPLKIRRDIGELYRKELMGLDKIKLMEYKQDRTPNYQIFPIHVENREKFANYMIESGIQVIINNRRNDIYSIFGGQRTDLPNTKKADEDVILLPIHADLTTSDTNRIINCARKYENK